MPTMTDRAWLGVPLLLVIALMLIGGAGCGSDDDHQDGHLIGFYGVTEGSVLAPGHVKAGEVLGYAFPQIGNKADSPMTLKSIELTHVPDGAEVVKYRFLSAKDVGSVLLGSFPVDQHSNEGYDRYPGYNDPVVPANSESDYYGVVYLRVPGPLAGHASGCVVHYAVAGASYSQTGDCDFMFQNARAAMLHGGSSG